ncbi:MAG: SHOCT domain-containing protein [Clostridia bacterium]|nr:SHOCT domain-containing protein [Clostridia bacterium]
MIGYIIGVLIWGIIWGVVCKKVIENKGYMENWFWWGFFFGFIALIIALTKPEAYMLYGNNNNGFALDKAVNNPDSSVWKCECGSYVPLSSSVCPHCGKTKNAPRLTQTASQGANEWQCVCGKVHPNYVTSCPCGHTKSEALGGQKTYDDKKESPMPTNVTPDRMIPVPQSQASDGDKFEEIRKYKQLLDEGIISETEFAEKKKDLLKFSE